MRASLACLIALLAVAACGRSGLKTRDGGARGPANPDARAAGVDGGSRPEAGLPSLPDARPAPPPDAPLPRDAFPPPPLVRDAGLPIPFDGGRPFPPPFDGGPISPPFRDAGAPAVLVGLDLTPATTAIAVGTSVTFVLTGRLSNGALTDLTAAAAWSSSAPAIADVGGGVAKGASAGTATIRATVMGQSASATVTVSAAGVASIAIDPPAPLVARGFRLPLRATALLRDGTKQDVTTQATWSTADRAVATVDGRGELSGEAVGTTTVSAAILGVAGTAPVQVTSATMVSLEIAPPAPVLRLPGAQRLVATGVFSDGSRADLTGAASWESSSPGVAAVAAGVVTAASPGTTTVTARAGDRSASVTVTVSTARVMSVRVSPELATLPKGTSQAFTATVTYDDGIVADGTTLVAWSVTGTAAAVSNAPGSQGVVTALSPGGAAVMATLGGAVGSARLVVTDATLTGLAIAPKTPSVPLGRQVQLTATATYSDGSTRDVTAEASWASADPGVAAVGNGPGTAGRVQAGKLGSADISASHGGRTDSTRVQVTSAVLQGVTVRPATASTTVGLRQAFTATGSYSDGSSLDVTAQVIWSSDDPRVAGVSNAVGSQGQATALAAGTTAIRARLGGVEGTATFTVTLPQLVRLSVEPINPMGRVGQAVSLAAAAIYSNNTVRSVGPQATWTSSDPTVASQGSVADGGFVPGPVGPNVFTCRRAGSTTITASYMGVSDSVTMTCVEPRLQALEVNPFSVSVAPGGQAIVTANGIYSDGSVRPVEATWTASDPAVVRLMPAPTRPGFPGPMLVFGVAPGMATLTASYMGLTATARVTVGSAMLMGLAVAPAAAAIRVGQNQALQAVATFADGTSRDVTFMAVWASSDPTVADVSSLVQRGLVTGVRKGMATITATYMGMSASAQVSVVDARLKALTISPLNVRLVVGQTQQYVATAEYDDGTTQNVTGQTIWSSSDDSVVHVSNTTGGIIVGPVPGGAPLGRGGATALKPGSASITGVFQDQMATVTVTVAAAKLTSVAVSPRTTTARVGDTVTFQAVAVYDDGTSFNVAATATWASSAPTVATVPVRGFGATVPVLAVGSGKAMITVTFMGLSDSATINVTSAPLQSVRIAPASPVNVSVGGVRQLQATAVYADGLTQDVTFNSTWASSNTSLVDVSNAPASRGQAAGLATGMATVTVTYMGLAASVTVVVAP